jgi:DNA-binding GntR family transcriptional regulator
MHYDDSSERDVPDEHRQLMNAALGKDIDQACDLLSRHYQTTTDSVLKHALLVQA